MHTSYYRGKLLNTWSKRVYFLTPYQFSAPRSWMWTSTRFNTSWYLVSRVRTHIHRVSAMSERIFFFSTTELKRCLYMNTITWGMAQGNEWHILLIIRGFIFARCEFGVPHQMRPMLPWARRFTFIAQWWFVLGIREWFTIAAFTIELKWFSVNYHHIYLQNNTWTTININFFQSYAIYG